MKQSLHLCILVSLFLSLGVVSLSAQSTDPTISIPYSMSFEKGDSVELQNWVLNPGRKASLCPEQWMVGEATANDGKQALYISADDGVTEHFGVARNVQYAYRDVLLPKGSYNLTFDWRCMGNANSSTCLYVGAGPISDLSALEASNTSAALPTEVIKWVSTHTVDGKEVPEALSGVSHWRNKTMKFPSNGNRVIRLFFAWTNANNDTTLAMPVAACIDNIQITTANCLQPISIDATSSSDSIIVSWEGASEKYVFEYRKRGSQKWNILSGIYQSEGSQTTSVVLEGMDEGAYDFRVRGVCNDVDTSAYRYLNSYVMFRPEKHCINYVDLQSPDVVCTYGTYQDPMAIMGVVDFGWNSIDSRHTVNWEPDTYDPRTNYQLPLIPDGELASVRVGNWDINSEGEAISYNYTVDAATAAILLVRYAVVLEDPGHGGEQPQFRLEIFDEYGTLIDPTCGAAYFTYDDAVDAGWNRCHANGASVAWKNWTTIGLNLEDYDGQTLSIRLSSYDCGWGAHFGYAYFTLGCAAARIEGTSCGDEAQMTIQAPEGFDYAWYDYKDSLVATTMQLSILPSDTTTYRCHLSYKEDMSCGFDLYSAARPRFPVADFAHTYKPADCRNIVRFTNKSHILTKFNDVEEHHYDEPCDSYEWTFMGDGLTNPIQVSDIHPIVSFPNEGGTYTATLFASIAEGMCVEDTTFAFTIPAIGDTEEVIDSTICEGSYIQFDKYVAAETGEYYSERKSQAGCDSIVTLRLKVNPQSTTFLGDTTVCAEEPLCIDGECYKLHESGKWVRFYLNQYGCDSTTIMNVTMLDSILPIITIEDVADVENSGNIILGGTGYDYYEINGERNGNISNLNGGIFELAFYNDFGCSIDTTVIMNYSCLHIQLGELSFACVDDREWVLPFVIDSGVPTTYSLIFDDTALAQGFVNQEDVAMPLDAFIIPISATATPGIYHAQLILRDVLCEDVVINLTLPLNFSKDLIFQRWNDVLSVKNPTYNGGFTFIGFQWYKNGMPIMGANKSYYVESGGLDVEATYRVEVQLEDSTIFTTCDFVPQLYQQNATVYPTQATADTEVTIVVPDKGRVTCYATTGLAIASAEVQMGRNTFKVPSSAGVYLLRVETKAGVEIIRITVE